MEQNNNQKEYRINLKKSKISLVRMLISPKRSQISYLLRFWSNVLMFFSVLFGLVVLLFLIKYNNKIDRNIILGVGLFFIFFGILEFFVINTVNIIIFNLNVKKIIKKNKVLIYEKLFSENSDIKLKNIDAYKWQIEYNGNQYNMLFDDNYLNYSIGTDNVMHWNRNIENILNYKYRFTFKYAFITTSSFYQTVVLYTINRIIDSFEKSYFEIMKGVK